MIRKHILLHSRHIISLALLTLIGAGYGPAFAQCKLYRTQSAVNLAAAFPPPPTGNTCGCATVSCNAPNDPLVSCGLGPGTTIERSVGRGPDFAYLVFSRKNDTTCEACACNDDAIAVVLEVEATCIATQ